MFSVVIPLYNKEQYISRTIRSVLNQTFQDFEIIIVDDGSTDRSVSEVKKFDDPRIRLISQKNTGVSVARNRGIEEAKIGMIAFLDADDEWLPNHLEQIVNLKINFPNCKVFATNYKIVDSSGKSRFPVDIKVLNILKDTGIIMNYFDAASRTAPPLWSSAIAVEKEAIESVGGFPIGVRMGEDLLVWAKLASHYEIAYSKKVTAVYNFKAFTELLDSEPAPDTNDTVGKELKQLIFEVKNTDNSTALYRYISVWHRMRANLFINNSNRKKALYEIIISIYFNPFSMKSYVMMFLYLLPHTIRNMVMFQRLRIKQKRIQ